MITFVPAFRDREVATVVAMTYVKPDAVQAAFGDRLFLSWK